MKVHFLGLIFLACISCQSQKKKETVSKTDDNNELDINSDTLFKIKKTKIIPVGDSANKFFDVDNDGDKDLIISGWTDKDEKLKTVTKLYLNDGKGNFTHDSRSKFSGVEYGTIDVADIDNDNDLDIVITGQQLGNRKFDLNEMNLVKIYTNTNGIFKELPDFLLTEIYWGNVNFGNINNDNSADLLVIANDISDAYLNNNGFSKANNINLEKLYFTKVALFDMDNDQDDDLVIQGTIDRINPKSVMYENKSGNFIPKNHNFIEVTQGILKSVDIDNDNDIDLFVSGSYMSDENITEAKSIFYKNDGKGNFSKIDVEIMGYDEGNAVFIDIDNDKDKDLIITGSKYYENESLSGTDLYLNDGNGDFKLHTQNILEYYSQHSLSAADIDGDGDQDILLTGYNQEDNPTTTLYINNLIQN